MVQVLRSASKRGNKREEKWLPTVMFHVNYCFTLSGVRGKGKSKNFAPKHSFSRPGKTAACPMASHAPFDDFDSLSSSFFLFVSLPLRYNACVCIII